MENCGLFSMQKGLIDQQIHMEIEADKYKRLIRKYLKPLHKIIEYGIPREMRTNVRRMLGNY